MPLPAASDGCWVRWLFPRQDIPAPSSLFDTKIREGTHQRAATRAAMPMQGNGLTIGLRERAALGDSRHTVLVAFNCISFGRYPLPKQR
jgi:hypothetical protein